MVLWLSGPCQGQPREPVPEETFTHSHLSTTNILQSLDFVQEARWASTRKVNQSGLTGTRDSEWQWHQLGHMQVCTSPQTTMPASHHSVFLQAGCRSCHPTNSIIYHGHQSSLICFLHLLRSTGSFLFNLCAWQSFCTISLQVSFGVWPGILHSIIHTFLHSVIVFFSQQMQPWQPVLPATYCWVQPRCYLYNTVVNWKFTNIHNRLGNSASFSFNIPGTNFTPNHQDTGIMPWWKTWRKLTWLYFLRKMKNTYKVKRTYILRCEAMQCQSVMTKHGKCHKL